jgi:quercetin dioxygenase-like cupin family protein
LRQLDFYGFHSRQEIVLPKAKLLSKNTSSKRLVGVASNLEGLIDYQEGSVVSRTIIDKKAGTITVFAFDENQGLSEHTAPYDALVYVISGEVDVTISGNPIKLTKGQMTILPANQPHALFAKSQFKMLLTMIKS